MFALRKIHIAFVLTAVLLISAAYFYFSREKDHEYEYANVERRDIIREVSVTGRVKSASFVELAFEKTGRVERVFFRVGDKVSSGQILIKLDDSELSAGLDQARADVKSKKAKLDELVRGTRPEELRLKEIAVMSKEAAFEDAAKNLIDKLNDAYTKSDDAVRNKADRFFIDSRGKNPQIVFYVESQLKIRIENARFTIEDTLNKWKALLDSFSGQGNFSSTVSASKLNLDAIKNFLDDTAMALADLSVSSSFSQTTIDGWRSDIAAARTNINSAIGAITSGDEKLRSAEAALALADQELILAQTGPTEEEIRIQEALLEQAEASVRNYQAQIAKTVIVTPISGIVTRQDAKFGEIVSSSKAVVSVISISEFEVEANLPEADVAEIKIGDRTKITLDAYGRDVVFSATVSFIDPAETIIDGVATYKTKIQFVEKDNRVRSGMTANIDIISGVREKVLALSDRAITKTSSGEFVRVLENDAVREIPVKTGLKGSDGYVEIIEGLKEGGRVVMFIEE